MNPTPIEQIEHTRAEQWHAVCPWDKLKAKSRFLFRHEKAQIVVFLSNGHIYALDNRCPHEGYPLIQGEMDPEQCTLTCHWHNWKFDIKSGAAKVGQDSVRTYPTKHINGEVWVDLSPPSQAELSRKILDSVQEGFEKRQYGRMARDLARFHYQGLDPLIALRAAIVWSHDKLEFGMTHAYAVTADWVHLYQRFSEPKEGLTALVEALDHMAFDALRHPTFAYTEGLEGFVSERFIQAIEDENEALAIRQLRGALAAGHSFTDLQPTLSQIALSHYNNFGHSLIYLVKGDELIQQLGKNVTEPLLLAWVRSLIYATREDLLPEFRDYAPLVKALRERTLSAGFGSNEESPDFSALQGASVKTAMTWVLEQSEQYRPEALYQSLLLANAHNLLYFDLSYQRRHDNGVADNVGWLDFTHALTFANAVRLTCEHHPELWPQGLLQLAAFYGRNTSYLDLNQNVAADLNLDSEHFWTELYQGLLDHGLGQPIFSAHLLKTARAVEDEAIHAPQSSALLIQALQRFLQGPIKQKHALRIMNQSLALVGRDFG